MPIRRFLMATLLLSLVLVSVDPPGAGAARGPFRIDRSPTSAEWDAGVVACRLQVIGMAADLRLETAPIECWIVPKGDRTPPWESGGVTTQSFTMVGYHYDGANFSGSYISVAGTVCSGGWLDLSWDWINRISSTSSPCWVGHYDGYGLSGNVEYVSFGNLSGTLNNKANSLQYI